MNRIPLQNIWRSQRLGNLASLVIVALMTACIAISIAQLGALLAPGWHWNALVGFSFVVSLQALVVQRATREYEFRPKLLSRLSELVVAATALKLMLVWLSGERSFMQNLAQWQDNFAAFFDPEYGTGLAITLLVWFLSNSLGADLAELYEPEERITLEDNRPLLEGRQDLQYNLALRVLSVGAGLVLLAFLTRLDLPAWVDRFGPAQISVANVVAYFLLAFVLLSFNQFAILITRWQMEGAVIEASLAGRWVLFSIVFIAIVTGVAYLLPTSYAVGLFDTLQWVVGVSINGFSLVLRILFYPFALLISFLASLFGKQPVQEPRLFERMPFPEMAAQSGQAPALEMLRAVLFWIVLVGVIGLAIVQYLRQNRDILRAMEGWPLAAWLSSAWRRFWTALLGLQRTIFAKTTENLQRVMRSRAAQAQRAKRWLPAAASPRQKVVAYYLAFVRRSSKQGWPRPPAQTPSEYAQTLEGNFPEVKEDLAVLTDGFLKARYSQHEIEARQATLVRRLINKVLKAFVEKANGTKPGR